MREPRNIIGGTVIIAFVVTVQCLIWFPPKADAAMLQALVQMIGSLGTLAGTIVGFYFGSSQGSREKDETIKQIASPTPPSADAIKNLVKP